MSMRIPSPLPQPTTALRKPEPAKDRPGVAAAPSAAPVRAPLVETDVLVLDGLAATTTGALPVPDAEGTPSATAEDARTAADQLRADLLAQPGQAARAHGNLIPATVLNLLA
ncbi:MAG: hypothetical protein IPK64_07780 [bacterium]|nr:hypothetical protein [bacterium]